MTSGALARLLEAQPELATAITAHALLAARLLPLAAITPLLGLSRAPATLRGAAALALAVGCSPAATLAPGARATALGLLAESAAGAFFAIVAALPLFALSMAGRLVDTSRGVVQPGERDLVEGEPSNAVGQLYAIAGIALFFSVGAHLAVVRAFADGLAAVPLGAVTLSTDALFDFATLAGKALAFGVALALPAFVAVLLVEAFLGLISRAAPTIPVFHAGMPLRALAGLFVAALTLGLSLAAFSEELGHALQLALRALGGP